MSDKNRSAEIKDLHREVSLALLESISCYCVRTPRGQKDPGHLGWDPKTQDEEQNRMNMHRLKRNDDNLGVHLFGRFVDIDVDTDNPMITAALDYFLPATAHVWGRGERTRTHRLYELTSLPEKDFNPNLFPFLDVIKKRDDLKVEIRGGEKKNGRYTLLPGSLHPSGDVYQWDNVGAAKSTPVAVDAYRVVDSLRFALVTALIAPYWTEGVRNELCMALSGFMHRAAAHVEDMGAQSTIYFTRAEAERLLEGILSVSDDDEADYQMRLRTFNQTWDKADKGDPTTGAKRISEITGDKEILQLLYILLADTPDLVELDRFMERYAVRNNTSNVIDLELAGSKEAKFIMTVNDFRNSNLHKNITSGTGGRVQMSNVLLGSPRAIRIDGFDFDPSSDRMIEYKGRKFVNQWCGYEIPPADDVREDEVRPFLDYVFNVLADGKQAFYEWILAWIADIFQNPKDKCGTALVLVGKTGSGKSMLGDMVLRRIIGTNHSMQTNTLESITNNFNNDSNSVLLVQCDEAANTRRRSDANRMKSLITDRSKRVEPKGVDAFQVRDCARYLFTSNEQNDAVAIVDGKDDRRYAVFLVSGEYSYSSPLHSMEQKRKYWNELSEWFEKDSNLAKIHRYLLELPYLRNMIREPIDTQARRIIQQHSVRGLDEWMMELAASEHPFDTLPERYGKMEDSWVWEAGVWQTSLERWPDAMPYRVMVDSYNHYRRKNGVTNSTPSFNEQQLKQEFVRRGLLSSDYKMARVYLDREEWLNDTAKQTKKRVRITEVPTHNSICRYVENTVGFEVDKGVIPDVEIGKSSSGGKDEF